MNHSEIEKAVTNRAIVSLRTDSHAIPASLRGARVKLMGAHFYGPDQRITIGFLNADDSYAGEKMTAPLEWLA
jgi:hypothetical protein